MDDLTQLIDTNDIEVEVTIRLGRTRLTVAELSALRGNDVLTLDQSISDGVEICVGEKIVARGELTGDGTPENRLCIRIIGAAETP
ncbi:MAG: FliM/FliN family flagellar motor switch protein [Paracoccus sp. (in: a-proteobacteria)]